MFDHATETHLALQLKNKIYSHNHVNTDFIINGDINILEKQSKGNRRQGVSTKCLFTIKINMSFKRFL